MANAFEIQVKAILESTDITQRLKEIQDNLKPIKINLDTGVGGSGETLAKSFESAASSATTLSSKIVGVKGEFYKLAKQEEDYTKIRRDAYQAFGKYVPSDEMKQLNQYFREQAKNADMDEKAAQKEADTFVKGAKAKQAEEEKMQKLWDASVKQQAAAAQKYSQYLKQEENAVESLNNKEANIFQQYQNRVIANANAIQTLTIRLSGLTSSQKEQTNAEQRLQEIKTTSNVTQQAQAIRSLTNDVNAASRGTSTFSASIEYMTERFLQITIIIQAFRKIISTITDMIDTVSRLDSSIVELKKVTDLTGDSLEGFVSRAYDAGSQLARTGQEVIDAAAIFSRSGYDIEDALDLSKTALMLMNVGDGINDVSTAATSLISILKGYNFEADKAAYVTDLLNEISNNAAINFEDLTDGLTRTAAVFNQAGVSISETSALLTATNEVLQNIESKIRYLSHSAYVQKCA